MKIFLQKSWPIINLFLSTFLMVSMFYFPSKKEQISITLIITNISMAAVLATKKHWQSFQQAECTSEKMNRNLILDLLGLLVTMGVAMYVGRFAGGYFGVHSGFWVGLLAGFAGGFLAAWVVRSAWSRLVLARI